MAKANGSLRYETIKALMDDCQHSITVAWCRDGLTHVGDLVDYDDDYRNFLVTSEGQRYNVEPYEIAHVSVSEYASDPGSAGRIGEAKPAERSEEPNRVKERSD